MNEGWLFHRWPTRGGGRRVSTAIKRAVAAITRERVRYRLLAALVAAHFVALFVLPVSHPIELALPVPNEWLSHLSLYRQASAGSTYAGLLFVAVAILGAAQLFRPRPPDLPRWLWLLGWLSVVGGAVFIAAIDISEALDLGRLLEGNPLPRAWLAVAAPVAALLLGPAGYVFWASQRGHPARALLVALAFMLAVGTLVRDSLTIVYSGSWWIHDYLTNYLEETWEVISVLIVIIVLLEMLAAEFRPSASTTSPDEQTSARRSMLLVSTMLAIPLLLLSIYAVNLSIERSDMAFEDTAFRSERPSVYAGPISLIEQEFQVDHDNLSLIKVWSYIDGGTEGEAAEIFARLTPAGSEEPLRESRAQVRGAKFGNTSVDFAFEPIPDSSGKVFKVAIGVLGASPPWVFLGLTDADGLPERAAIIGGEPEQHGNALAMATYWTGRAFLVHMGGAGSDPRRIVFAVDLAVTTVLWVFTILAAARGLSGCQPRFWKRYVGVTLWKSLLVSSGVATIGMLLLPMLLAGRPHG